MSDTSHREEWSQPTTPAISGRPSIERIGSYRIVDEIGSGGMAVVYKGIQESLGRTVAIKALKTSLCGDLGIVARFEREALSVASFQHENIITLYDYFKERGALFMVMEFVEGIDLYDLIDRAGRLPHDIAAIMALQVARALDYAHFRGVIHRDVKPANVIISRHGEVKLTDFGIARTEHSDLTETGVGLGTPAYMSPEQVIGDKLDHRSDIWSLGVLLYQMVTGQKPFTDTEQRSAMQRIRLEEPTPLADLEPMLPRDLADIVERCMEKDLTARYAATQTLVVELEQYLAKHVHANYRAQIVLYLKEQGVISDDETSAMLHPALLGSYETLVGGVPSGPRRGAKGGSRTGPLVHSALVLAGLLLGGAGGWVGHRLLRAPVLQSEPSGMGQRPPVQTLVPSGKLYVRVQPWAHVKVDGKLVDTTPFAHPLILPVGEHTVALESPYMVPVVRKIRIEEDRAVHISHPPIAADGAQK